MPDYSKAKIYTIRCRSNPEHIYVGSTVNPLYKRLGQHKTKSKTNPERLFYSHIKGNWDDWYIELYQEYPCENKEQLNKREGEVIREIATLNIHIAGRTQKEYVEDNKEIIQEYKKKFAEKNKEINVIRKHEWYEAHKERTLSIQKEKYEANKEVISLIRREKYNANKDAIVERQREYRQRKKLEKNNIAVN